MDEPGEGRHRFDYGRLLPLIPAALAFVIDLWRLGTPSLWRDEAVTIDVAQRSIPDTFRLLNNIDAVHGLYYLVMHPLVGWLGTGVEAVRLPSVVGAAVAAGGVTVLGRQLADGRVGLLAGLLLAISPSMTRYAQEARQYTIVTAIAVIATCLLVRACRNGRGWSLYAVAIVLLGYMHLFALLLVPAHAVMVCTTRDRRLIRRWTLATLVAAAATAPLLIRAKTQRGAQVDWIRPPGLSDVWDLVQLLAGATWLVAPLIGLFVIALWPWKTRQEGLDPRWVGLSWLVLPPALLLGISLWEPSYVFRYVLFCVPAAALLAALGLRRIPPVVAAGAVVALAELAVPMQLEYREQNSRQDNLHELAQVIRTYKQPGDAIVFHHTLYRRVMAAYPDSYKGLWDVARAKTGAQAGNLSGTEIPPAQLAQRLQDVRRVWYVHSSSGTDPLYDNDDAAKDRLVAQSDFLERVERWHFRGGSLYLYSNAAYQSGR